MLHKWLTPNSRSGLEGDGEAKDKAPQEVPENYRGLSFSIWLDIFLEYALCLVRFGKQQEAYEICEAAKDAIVFYHNKEDMFLIHLTWCGKVDQSLCSRCPN